MTVAPDEPRDLRGEDAFDVDALHGWLSARVEGPAYAHSGLFVGYLESRCRSLTGTA